MARKPMVTRTIASTRVNVLCLNLATCEPFNKDYELAGVYKNEQEILKAVEPLLGEEGKPVHVVLNEKQEKLYGLTEDEFIKAAQELDPETRKPIVAVGE